MFPSDEASVPLKKEENYSMFPNVSVEKTTTYNLTKKEVEALLLKEAGLDRMATGTVKITWECTGGYTPAYDNYETGSYTPMDVYSVKIEVKEKSKS